MHRIITDHIIMEWVILIMKLRNASATCVICTLHFLFVFHNKQHQLTGRRDYILLMQCYGPDTKENLFLFELQKTEFCLLAYHVR